MKMKLSGLWLALIVGIVLASPVPAAEKPFAEHKVVLQISDGDPFKQTLVLNVASNAVKAYGPDNVDIEIVAFGPGLRLLFDDNVNKPRIRSLADSSGIRFHACSNTIESITRKLGKKPVINALASADKGGIVRILELVDKGYVLVKP
jgi:intracellular sulfur oxidation DsrE/DsrF family protein